MEDLSGDICTDIANAECDVAGVSGALKGYGNSLRASARRQRYGGGTDCGDGDRLCCKVRTTPPKATLPELVGTIYKSVSLLAVLRKGPALLKVALLLMPA